MPSQKSLTIAIKDDGNTTRKTARILIAKDSSLGLLVPHFPDMPGTLMRADVPGIRPPTLLFQATILEQYWVPGPVKLSVHPSGFVQFSTAGKTVIRSGRKPFLLPKGLGIEAQGLLDPVDTGPTFGAGIFGLPGYPAVHGHVPGLQTFREGDFFERDRHDGTPHSYQIEVFVFPGALRPEIAVSPRGLILRRFYSYRRPEWGEFVFRVVLLPTNLAFLGILVSRYHLHPEIDSVGYSLNGPRDLTHRITLSGIYPAEQANLPSLVYVAPDDGLDAGTPRASAETAVPKTS